MYSKDEWIMVGNKYYLKEYIRMCLYMRSINFKKHYQIQKYQKYQNYILY